jgi:hypothetical protein
MKENLQDIAEKVKPDGDKRVYYNTEENRQFVLAFIEASPRPVTLQEIERELRKQYPNLKTQSANAIQLSLTKKFSRIVRIEYEGRKTSDPVLYGIPGVAYAEAQLQEAISIAQAEIQSKINQRDKTMAETKNDDTAFILKIIKDFYAQGGEEISIPQIKDATKNKALVFTENRIRDIFKILVDLKELEIIRTKGKTNYYAVFKQPDAVRLKELKIGGSKIGGDAR